MRLSGTVTGASEQRPRMAQEDCSLAMRFGFRKGRISGWLLAVMDGFGGAEVAAYCKDRIPQYFAPKAPEDIRKTLEDLIARLAGETDHMVPGATLSIVCSTL